MYIMGVEALPCCKIKTAKYYKVLKGKIRWQHHH
jgi:hypothetical protein